MSAASSCDCPCPTPVVTMVPGSAGTPGVDGLNGVGLNSFTPVAAPGFTTPAAVGSNSTIPVGYNSWMAIGQNIYVQGAGYFEVVSLPVGGVSVVAEYLDYVGNTVFSTLIAAGAQVSPAGTQGPLTSPLPVANGGTGSATKATAQVALGVGQNLTQDFDDSLAYDITSAYATITGISVTVPAAGLYKIEACVTVSYTGVTFAASRLLSIRARNTTTSTTLTDKTVSTGIHTTLTFPAIDYVLPAKTAVLAAAAVVELQIQLDTVESAGSSVVTDAFLVITPLALT